MRLINVGFGNMVAANKILAIVSPESAPIKRIIQEGRERGLIDATYGENTCCYYNRQITLFCLLFSLKQLPAECRTWKKILMVRL